MEKVKEQRTRLMKKEVISYIRKNAGCEVSERFDVQKVIMGWFPVIISRAH